MGSSGNALPVGDSGNSGQFAAGQSLDFEQTFLSERRVALPPWYVDARAAGGGSVSSQVSSLSAFNGDHTSAQKSRVVARARSTGTPLSYQITGLVLDAPRL